MIMATGILMLIGIALGAFGLYVMAESRDPLGYMPPGAPIFFLIGCAFFAGGAIWRGLAG